MMTIEIQRRISTVVRRAWPGFVAATVMACAAVAAVQQSPTRVVRGQRVVRGILGADSHHYRVALRDGQSLHLVVNQLSVDVRVLARGPDGETLVEMDTPSAPNGPEHVHLIAKKDGDYEFAVHPLRNDARGRYELVVIAIRQATRDDRMRVDMQ